MKKEKILIIIKIIVIVLMFVPTRVFLSIFAGIFFEKIELAEFDKTQWDSFSENFSDDKYIRRKMIKNLLETYEIIGMSKEEIRDLLGYDASFDYIYNSIAYKVSSGMIEPLYLVIYFDENDIAIEYELVEF